MINSVNLIGRITHDVAEKFLPSGMSVVNVNIALNEYFKDKQGNKNQESHFFDVEVYGKQATFLAQYGKKGQELAVSGKLRYSVYEKNGTKVHKVSIVANQVQLFKSGGNDSQEPKQAQPAFPVDSTLGSLSGFNKDFDDELPF